MGINLWSHLVWVGPIRQDVQQISWRDEVKSGKGQTLGVQVFCQSLFTQRKPVEIAQHMQSQYVCVCLCETYGEETENRWSWLNFHLLWMSSSLRNRPGLLVASTTLGVSCIAFASSLKSASIPSKRLESCRGFHEGARQALIPTRKRENQRFNSKHLGLSTAWTSREQLKSCVISALKLSKAN